MWGLPRKLQIICSGGVFNRAEGLAEEIGSDLFANNPLESLEILANYPGKRATPEQQTVEVQSGASRNRRSKNKGVDAGERPARSWHVTTHQTPRAGTDAEGLRRAGTLSKAGSQGSRGGPRTCSCGRLYFCQWAKGF